MCQLTIAVSYFITPILKSLVVPVIWLAQIGVIKSRIAPFFALNFIFSQSMRRLHQKQNNQSDFKACNQSNFIKMWDKEYHVANFATFVSKTVIPPPKKWMNLISNQLSTASIKYFNWPRPVFEQFQNGCYKVVIEPRVVQFWSEIILVVSNLTRTACSFNFEITHMISAQIALHSVQLPLFISCGFIKIKSIRVCRAQGNSWFEK